METEAEELKEYVFITNINITEKNVNRMIVAGRIRWNIEYQGFNGQKIIVTISNMSIVKTTKQ